MPHIVSAVGEPVEKNDDLLAIAAGAPRKMPAECRADPKNSMCRQPLASRASRERQFALSCHRPVGGLRRASPSPNCDLTKARRSGRAAVSVQTYCSRYANFVGDRTCIMFRQPSEATTQGATAVLPVVCGSDAARRQTDGSRSDAIISGIVDSGRESGHVKIDANDPHKPSGDVPSSKYERYNLALRDSFDLSVRGMKLSFVPLLAC